jgi:hypothetical protein
MSQSKLAVLRPPLIPPSHPDAPKYWMHETSGQLAAAIQRYLRSRRLMKVRDVAMMRAYFRQWINSPVWDQNPHESSRANLGELRRTVEEIVSVEGIDMWLRLAEHAGLDPL